MHQSLATFFNRPGLTADQISKIIVEVFSMTAEEVDEEYERDHASAVKVITKM